MKETPIHRSETRLTVLRKLNIERLRLGRRPLAVYERDEVGMGDLSDELARWRAYTKPEEIQPERVDVEKPLFAIERVYR